MPLFYVLINSDLGGEEQMKKEIEKTLGKEVDFEVISVYGVYDVVIRVKDKTFTTRSLQDKLKTVSKIHSVMILTVC